MLPMFDKRTIASVIGSRRGKHPDIEINSEVEAPDSNLNPALKAAAEDVLRAIDTKSPIDLAKALKAAFDICDSEPHEEGPHINEDQGQE